MNITKSRTKKCIGTPKACSAYSCQTPLHTAQAAPCNEYHRDERAEEHHGCHWRPQRVVLKHHWQYANRCRSRCKEYRTHTALARLEGSLSYRQAFVAAQLLGIIEHNDAVAHQDTHQAYYSQDARYRHIIARNEQADGGAEHTQSDIDDRLTRARDMRLKWNSNIKKMMNTAINTPVDT